MVADVAEQQARLGPVDDQPDVAADPHRPEVLVLRLVELVELQPGLRRVDLQVEGRRLDGLLLVAGQAGEAVGEGVGDEEVQSASGQMYETRSEPVRLGILLRGVPLEAEVVSPGTRRRERLPRGDRTDSGVTLVLRLRGDGQAELLREAREVVPERTTQRAPLDASP